MSKLVINGTEISTDSDGRFSLNDLHKASGGKSKHQPSYFIRNSNVIEVAEILNLQKSGVKAIERKAGRYNGGTWVCKELVYKYAMWVNAKFEVQVIQTFDSVVNKLNTPSSMAALNELTAKIESDKNIASFCGKELAKYKLIKKENEQAFAEEVLNAQLTLGFTG